MLGKLFARAWFRATGWKTSGAPPVFKKYVIIAAPHTSLWDAVYMLCVAAQFDVPLHWMVKHTMMRPPLGSYLRWLGGIAVDRRAPQGLVKQMAKAFSERDRMALAIPPEGTRSYVEYWKGGFYHIAQEAKVPIVCAFLDFERKRGGVGPTIWPSGDFTGDMNIVREFYRDKVGRHPELMGPIRLRDEATDS